jgi:exonuclease VII small subunit
MPPFAFHLERHMIQINQEQYFKNKIVELDNRVAELEAKIAAMEEKPKRARNGNNYKSDCENAITD